MIKEALLSDDIIAIQNKYGISQSDLYTLLEWGMNWTTNIADRVDPYVLEKYLKETGWTVYPTKRKDIVIFQYVTDKNLEQVTIPLDRNLSDYTQAIRKAVKKIIDVQKCSI